MTTQTWKTILAHLTLVSACVLLLAGCAGTTGTYNKSAMPTAASALQQEAVGCKARWTANEFKTYSAWQACQLTAERGFARAIALTKMDAFEVYAADMQALAVDRDANRVTDRQVRSRANDIYWRFLADCGCRPESARRFTANFASFDGYPSPNDNIPSGNLVQR